jgi:hypothetical protein
LDLDLNLNSVELKFSFDSIQFNSNSIEDKWVTNCCKTYWKFSCQISIICDYGVKTKKNSSLENTFVGLALVGKDIVFRFIIEYSSLRDFGPY